MDKTSHAVAARVVFSALVGKMDGSFDFGHHCLEYRFLRGSASARTAIKIKEISSRVPIVEDSLLLYSDSLVVP